METPERILILDFGSQYTQVIARRIREANVYSEIVPYSTGARKIASLRPRGIILSGGPASVYAKDAPKPDPEIFNLGIPILGICYGMQLLAHFLGGEVAKSQRREYGRGLLQVDRKCGLFRGLSGSIEIWNSHGDKVTRLPRGFKAAGKTENSAYAVVQKGNIFGLQFHPEVAHTPRGREIIHNFVKGVCGCKGTWTMSSFIDKTVEEIRDKVGKDRVILGLSGGVDSSVAAALLHRAIGGQLVCILVDNGLLRANEVESVKRIFGKGLGLKLKVVDASDRFLSRLRGVSDPERKRKIIGTEFIRVFEAATRSVGKAKFLAQGTLYPDIIESVSIDGNPAALIKSHHNVGGLPKRMKFKLIEPLSQLFKDEVRAVGEALGLPKEMVWRQPFPGPGLAVRCLGPVDRAKLQILREADAVVVEEMKLSGWYYKIWQSFAVLLPVRSVGVMGDERTYDFTIAVRAVESQDAMTADWAKLPYDLLGKLSTRIINEVKGVNRVVLDISSKPPATIEWE
ncbi:MAG: glutamine-hydrolyzing GMP synthase [Methylacidiphilales bacterium]|nr:glutamine-hydrolyzing GMP synthase [Candidatus Methylacidiphilales bacterium]